MPPRHASLPLPSLLAGLLLAPVLLSCTRPNSERIQAWKRDPAGADRLVAALKDPGVSPALRGEAAAALVESGNGDQMEAALAGMDVDTRSVVVPPTVGRLSALVTDANAERAGDARTALYALRQLGTTTEARVAVDAVLVPALVADVRAGRARAGRRAVKDMLVGVGAPVVPALLPLLPDPAVPFATVVDVIDEVGDADAHHKGGAGLVAHARRLAEGAPAPEGLWPALARLGGKEAAAFFMETIDGTDAARAEAAATALAKLRGEPEVTAFAVRKAGNPTTPPALRDRLYEVAEQDHRPEAKQALVALIASSALAETRYRAFQALLKSAGGGGLLEGLEAFPANVSYSADDVRAKLVAPIGVLAGLDTRGPLFKAFDSKSPLARLVALLSIENMGFASDAKLVSKLEKDRGAVKGLPPSDQVGRQATRIAAALSKKTS
jgi:hypothetical protein